MESSSKYHEDLVVETRASPEGDQRKPKINVIHPMFRGQDVGCYSSWLGRPKYKSIWLENTTTRPEVSRGDAIYRTREFCTPPYKGINLVQKDIGAPNPSICVPSLQHWLAFGRLVPNSNAQLSLPSSLLGDKDVRGQMSTLVYQYGAP